MLIQSFELLLKELVYASGEEEFCWVTQKKKLIEKRKLAEEKRQKELQLQQSMKSMTNKLDLKLAEQIFRLEMQQLNEEEHTKHSKK